MTGVRSPSPVAEPGARRRGLALGAAFLPYAMGNYGALSVLAPLVDGWLHSAALVGAALLTLAVGDGLGGLLLTSRLHRWSYRGAMVTSMTVAGAALAVLASAPPAAVTIGALAVTGVGGSVYGILGRTFVAETTSAAKDRHRVFSAVQVAVCIGAAAGPALFGLLLTLGRPRLVFVVGGALYCTAGLILAALMRDRRRPGRVATRWPVSRESMVRLARSPVAVRILCLVAVGSALDRQFYSAFALSAGGVVDANQRASLFWVNALLVAALQVPVSRVVEPLLGRPGRMVATMGAGVMLFALALSVMGLAPLCFMTLMLVVVVFSIAETVYTPTVSTAVAQLPAGSVLEAFGVRQIVWTAGGGLGVLLGGTVYLSTTRSHPEYLYWLVLAGLALAAASALVGWQAIASRGDPSGQR
ncbi:MFS transporter [Dactylosporangium sp. CA-139114]|uniref:MFS transporter n=1 Tax=Dactylosporangium sp. CA-139114 TaxID=3239931 RepID=UPI003D9935F7